MAGMTRRSALATGGAMAASATADTGRTTATVPAAPAPDAIERWGVAELSFRAAAPGNPFDVMLKARFTNGTTTVVVPGFFDGDDVFRVRFSPPETGTWTWRTESDLAALDGREARFEAVQPSPGNHGPVGVVGDYHFAHADGTSFRQIGTTSYGWPHQPEERRLQTLETLRKTAFNKIRMLVFPNTSVATNEPLHPYQRTGEGDRDHDLTRFNPAFFRRLDDCVRALGDQGVQADVILFHPYDGKHGFDEMTPDEDARYLRYVVARLSAYRNVWWSLANEFDILKSKTDEDWDRLFQVVRDADPHGRLRSIHNWRRYYDNGKPWVTHSSIQNGSAVLDDVRAETYRSVWKKAVVFDEVCYEGNLSERWGDLTGEQMVRAFWHGLVGGTYVGHSECFPKPGGTAGGFWLGEGGELRGESWPRLAFLKSVMDAGPTPGIDPIDKWWEQRLGGVAGRYYLRYFGDEAPTDWAVDLPRDELSGGERFRVEVLDTWNMTTTPVPGEFVMEKREDTKYFFRDPARPTIPLPGRKWMAVRVTRLE